MKVIQCDKCKKILSGTDNRFETVNLRHDGFIDLCDECEIKYEDCEKNILILKRIQRKYFLLR